MTTTSGQGEGPNTRLEDLFARVVDLSSEERSRVVANECGEDPAMRARLQRLLDAHDGAECLMPTPPVEGTASEPIGLHLDPLLGESIGMFRVERTIGMGGMGTVYEATQESPKRRVALKVMRAGLVARGAAQRFRSEAEALGALKHVGIAKIFEAGVAATRVGRLPYFAMELIEGRSLLDHAKAKGLNVEARIALFATVCDAVEHAHRRGIIHRDLKPGNILVTEDGSAKVLDFGVARLAATDLPVTSLHTEAGQLLGTLQYMSPEQASGDPRSVDTRSDVYSLGVVLYELLAGVLPYDVSTATLLQAAQMIREREPRALGDLVPELKGDAETIVRKAIEKRPEVRYQSAAELAADLRRFLTHEPISARPPSATYYLRKFVRRNKTLSIGAGATFLALVLGVIGTSIGLKRAVDARTLADKNAAESALNAARSEINEYVANVQAAGASMRAGDLSTARARLDGANPAFRAWEWNYINSQCDQSVRTLVDGPRGFVSGLALSPNETQLAVVADGAISIYDVATGSLLRSRPRAELTARELGRVAWSPDGSRLALTLPYDPKVVVLDSTSLEIVASLQAGKKEYLGLGWSPLGMQLVVGCGHWTDREASDRVLQIWNTSDWSLQRTIEGLPSRGELARWSLDGRWVLISTSKGCVLLDALDWSRRDVERGVSMPTPIRCAAWSPDGTHFAVACEDRVSVYDAATLGLVTSIPIVNGKAGQVAFSFDGANIVISLDSGLTILDARNGKFVRNLRGSRGAIFDIVTSQNGPTVWTGGSDGSVKQWSLQAVGDVLDVRARDNALPTPDFSRVVHSSPVFGQDGLGPVTIRDGRTSSIVREVSFGSSVDGGSEVHMTADARFVVRNQSGPYLSVCDLQSDATREIQFGDPDHPVNNASIALFQSGDGVVHAWQGRVLAFSIPDLSPMPWPDETFPAAEAMLWDSDARVRVSWQDDAVALCGKAGLIRIVRRESEGSNSAVLPTQDIVRSIAFSRDGAWIAASADRRIWLLESKTLRVAASYSGLLSEANDLCFDDAGRRVFVPQLDGTVRILGLFALPDSPDPRLLEVASLRAGNYWMMRVRMSVDGTRLFSATVWPANRYFIWDARGESNIYQLLKGDAAPTSAGHRTP